MMKDQKIFLEKRTRLIKYWPWMGGSLLAVIIGLAVFFYFRVPLMINPMAVFSRLEAGTLPKSTLETIAVLLPVAFLMIFFLLAVLILLIFVAIRNEKKYLMILKNLSGDS